MVDKHSKGMIEGKEEMSAEHIVILMSLIWVDSAKHWPECTPNFGPMFACQCPFNHLNDQQSHSTMQMISCASGMPDIWVCSFAV